MYCNGAGMYCLGNFNIMKVYGPMWVQAVMCTGGGVKPLARNGNFCSSKMQLSIFFYSYIQNDTVTHFSRSLVQTPTRNAFPYYNVFYV